ncbi:hypothetical protein HGM15179_017079, partial [Zosterops borbonicus]
RQAAYDLFACVLEKWQVQSIDIKKELPGLLAYGYAKKCFINPHTVHKLSECLDDDKTAKKNQWRAVCNALLQHQQAVVAQEMNLTFSSESDFPLPPGCTTVHLPPEQMAANSVPSAPPMLPVAVGQLTDTCPLPWTGESDETIPKVESDLTEVSALAKEGVERGNAQMIEARSSMACPVIYNPAPGGSVTAQLTSLDWKLLSQLRSTVSQYEVNSEPARQMLDYIWSTYLLLPADCRGISKLVFTPHQLLLFQAHWQALAQESVATQRQPGDPLHEVTLDKLLGIAQALLGPEKSAMDEVKDPHKTYIYMRIKQSTEEPLGKFVNQLLKRIKKARVPLYMQRAMLKQCILQNSNQATKNLVNTLRANGSVEEALEKGASVPSRPQAFIVEAIKRLGETFQKQAESSQAQVFATLAPLQAAVT